MINKNKKILILIILVIIVLIVCIITQSNQKDETVLNVELSELIDIEDIENISYEIEKTKEEISTKYADTNEKYEVKVNAQTDITTGKIIFLRGNYSNVNIYKVEYSLGKYENQIIRIKEIVEEFETECEKYMETTEENYTETEQIYELNNNENNKKFNLPIEESIYKDGNLYSKTYKSNEIEYNINIYKKDSKIICEFAKL